MSGLVTVHVHAHEYKITVFINAAAFFIFFTFPYFEGGGEGGVSRFNLQKIICCLLGKKMSQSVDLYNSGRIV